MVSPVVGSLLCVSIAIVSIIPAMWMTGWCNGEQANPEMPGCKSQYSPSYQAWKANPQSCPECYEEEPTELHGKRFCEPIRVGKQTVGHDCQPIPANVAL